MTNVAETNGTVNFDQTLTDTRALWREATTGGWPAPTLPGTVSCAACQATFHAPHDCPHKAASLPEAPASVNVHLELAGRQVQLTLRDSDEGRLLARLDAILQRFPLVVKPTDETPRCPTSREE